MRTHVLGALALASVPLLGPGCAAQIGDLGEEQEERDALEELEAQTLLEDTELMFPGERGLPGAMTVEVDGVPTELEIEDFDGYRVLEGDIVLDAPEEEAEGELGIVTQGLAAVRRPLRWPGGVVPYEIADDLPDKERVRSAIRHWNRNTPIRLVRRTNQESYVRFRRGRGCAAQIGYGRGRRLVWLHRNCHRGTVIHEIGHVVGLFHEQSRTDRGEHVRIRWRNIAEGQEANFRTYRALGVDGVNVGQYDVGSIMHYGSYAFSRNGRPTIVRVGGGIIRPNRDRLSERDLRGIRRIY